ncbi:MAG: TatD family hydrolase [Acidobacteria bacterium]|nr:TatD family hydrolase [Acidobacteriota bacterium]
MFVDSHAHLDTPNYDADRAAVIARAQAAGVELFLEIAGSDIGEGSLPKGLKLAEDHEFIYAAVGLHPHEASLFNDELEVTLINAARHAKVIGWGEIGLDYHYDHSPRAVQRDVFARQLELALNEKLPAIIHTREADDDTIAILQKHWADKGGSEIGGIIHCFTGTQALADAALAMGFHISFSGVVTFKAAEELRAVARTVPMERLLIETDCPFLAPVPHRGKRNEPAFVVETAKQLAALRGLSVEAIAQVTTANFKRLFGLATN